MATTLLTMLVPAAAVAFGLSQHTEENEPPVAPEPVAPIQPPQQPPQVADLPREDYKTSHKYIVNAKTMDDFHKSDQAAGAAERILRSNPRRNDGKGAQPLLANAESLYGKSVFNPNLYNHELSTMKMVGTFKNYNGKEYKQYENIDPEPTGIYYRNNAGRNRLQSMIGEDDLLKRTKRNAQNFHGANNTVRTDILPMDTRKRAQSTLNMDIQNNLNGMRPSNTNKVTRAPFGMAMEGGHFMLRPKPRLGTSMRHEASKQESANPRAGASNRNHGGKALRGKMRATANKTAKGRKGNKESLVDGPQVFGAITHCRDGTAKMKVNPLMQVDTQQIRPYGSFDDVKLSDKRGMQGGNAVAQVDTFGAKTRKTQLVSCTDRTTSRKRNPTLMVGEYGAQDRESVFTKDNTKRSMEKYRKEVEEALSNGVVLRAKNPCMINRTAAGPGVVANRDVMMQGEGGLSTMGEHSVKRQNFGNKLRMQQGGPQDGKSKSMTVGGPEFMKDLTTENRVPGGVFESGVHMQRNPVADVNCIRPISMPVKNNRIESTERMQIVDTSNHGEYEG